VASRDSASIPRRNDHMTDDLVEQSFSNDSTHVFCTLSFLYLFTSIAELEVFRVESPSTSAESTSLS
jgi:hypothetical protein